MKKAVIIIVGLSFIWAIDLLIYRGMGARIVYEWANSKFDKNYVSGTIKETRVDSGYVILYLSRNRPCEAIAVPTSEFQDAYLKAAIQPTTEKKLISLLTIGDSLVGERVSAKGRAQTQNDGSNFVFVDSMRQVRFRE